MLNRAISARMDEVFAQRGVPVIPTIGVCLSFRYTGINEAHADELRVFCFV